MLRLKLLFLSLLFTLLFILFHLAIMISPILKIAAYN